MILLGLCAKPFSSMFFTHIAYIESIWLAGHYGH